MKTLLTVLIEVTSVKLLHSYRTFSLFFKGVCRTVDNLTFTESIHSLIANIYSPVTSTVTCSERASRICRRAAEIQRGQVPVSGRTEQEPLSSGCFFLCFCLCTKNLDPTSRPCFFCTHHLFYILEFLQQMCISHAPCPLCNSWERPSGDQGPAGAALSLGLAWIYSGLELWSRLRGPNRKKPGVNEVSVSACVFAWPAAPASTHLPLTLVLPKDQLHVVAGRLLCTRWHNDSVPHKGDSTRSAAASQTQHAASASLLSHTSEDGFPARCTCVPSLPPHPQNSSSAPGVTSPVLMQLLLGSCYLFSSALFLLAIHYSCLLHAHNLLFLAFRLFLMLSFIFFIFSLLRLLWAVLWCRGCRRSPAVWTRWTGDLVLTFFKSF